MVVLIRHYRDTIRGQEIAPIGFEGDPAGVISSVGFGAADFVSASTFSLMETEDRANKNATQGNLMYVFFFSIFLPLATC